MATDTINPALLPQEGITYPIKVDYCPNCTMPFEVKNQKPRKIKQHKKESLKQDQDHQEKFLKLFLVKMKGLLHCMAKM